MLVKLKGKTQRFRAVLKTVLRVYTKVINIVNFIAHKERASVFIDITKLVRQ